MAICHCLLGAAASAGELGAANGFRPMEHVQRALPNAGVAKIEYRMMWPQRGEPPEALASVRREMWAAWAEEDREGWVPPADAPGDVAAATRQLADRFHARFRAFKGEFPDSAAAWSDFRKVDMVSRVGKLLSVTIKREWNTGGAHPARSIRHLVFDLFTGRRLDVADFVPAEKRPELTRRVRAAILAKRSLPPTATNAEAGLFDEAKVEPSNFFVDLRGIGFTFNECEIAPYAAGVIEVILPFPAVADLLRPEAAARMPTPEEIESATPASARPPPRRTDAETAPLRPAGFPQKRIGTHADLRGLEHNLRAGQSVRQRFVVLERNRKMATDIRQFCGIHIPDTA
ncbi:MAG: hypothetical protein BWK77_08120 [Verrucomicrobia bacterium A1]|nr:MAG: hypothetical protein BWK77_08120 [Verrucomicrobia bacterium A1]